MRQKNQILQINLNYFSKMLVMRTLPLHNLAQPQAVKNLIIFLVTLTYSKILVDLTLKLKNKIRLVLTQQKVICEQLSFPEYSIR